MARIFITGSSDGLGKLAAQLLINQGHQVVLHARNDERGLQALRQVPGAEKVLLADLASMEATKQLADEVNALGHFDAIIHNAGVYQAPRPTIFAVNTLSPYILTSLIHPPERLIYLSSGMHRQGNANLPTTNLQAKGVSYSDSKLYMIMLAMAVARHWPQVYANAVNPGWVPTKMGGEHAPNDLHKGYETQVWLAVSNDALAKVSGRYFFHQQQVPCVPDATDVALQEKLLTQCAEITGIPFPPAQTPVPAQE